MTRSTQDVGEQFAAFGLIVDGPPVIGKMTRVKVEGDKGGKKSGWYIVHELRLDSGEFVLVGKFGNWKIADEPQSIQFSNPLSDAERARFRAEQEAINRAKQAEIRQAQEEAGKRARRIWERLPEMISAPYLQRKKVRPFGVRSCRGALVVPMTKGVGGPLVNLQFIDPDGGKKFLTGGEKLGCCHVIGQPVDGEWVLEAEGYATAASIHMATGRPVVVAFDAGNLEPVARAIRSAFPSSPILVCADDDRESTKPDGTPYNAGRLKGEAAALAISGRVVWPTFTEAAA